MISRLREIIVDLERLFGVFVVWPINNVYVLLNLQRSL